MAHQFVQQDPLDIDLLIGMRSRLKKKCPYLYPIRYGKICQVEISLNLNPGVGQVGAVGAGMGAGALALSTDGGQPVGGLDVLGHLGGVGGGVAALGTLLLRDGHLQRDRLAPDL